MAVAHGTKHTPRDPAVALPGVPPTAENLRPRELLRAAVTAARPSPTERGAAQPPSAGDGPARRGTSRRRDVTQDCHA